MSNFKYILVFACCFVFLSELKGQCTVVINTYPYQESFEGGTANWFSGGINNDWAWGAPAKPVINSAGAGLRCWITGGLTASFYNLGERSWVESPCFDFTLVDRPYISFLIFWETERTYDGGNFQYSTDGGLSWITAGSNSDPDACNNHNWFNTSNIINLSSFVSNTNGWSGTVQSSGGGCNGGGGSTMWKRASHCLPALANRPQVKFRFTFGSGTTCNDYDGIAFDDFYIGDAPSLQNDFSFSCLNGKTVQFIDDGMGCFNSWTWNFDDPSSPANTASIYNPVHEFSNGGIYNVILNTGGPCLIDTQIVRQIKILDIDTAITMVSCFGIDDGAIQINVNNPGPGISYSWSHNSLLNAPVATGLFPGVYNIQINDPSSCNISLTATIEYGEDANPIVNLGSDTVICPGSQFLLSPGTFASYQWQDNSSDSVYSVSRDGIYSVSIINFSGCTSGDTISVQLDCLNDVLFPNAFTPNGDGFNEIFYADGSETPQYMLHIFDRWGQLIFSSDNRMAGWDGSSKGRPCQEGIYNYLLNYSIGNDERSKKGSVYLYR